ncbi:MAG: type II toxin-antitoxin system RelE/ParE family toxin [Candidatus Latescibacterota bacterium]
MTYVLSSAARDDLLSIWAYSAQRWGEDEADLHLDALVLRFAWLTRNAGLWHPRPELGSGLYSYPEKSHVIFLRQGDDRLEIVRVLHASMDPGRHVGP